MLDHLQVYATKKGAAPYCERSQFAHAVLQGSVEYRHLALPSRAQCAGSPASVSNRPQERRYPLRDVRGRSNRRARRTWPVHRQRVRTGRRGKLGRASRGRVSYSGRDRLWRSGCEIDIWVLWTGVFPESRSPFAKSRDPCQLT